MSNANEQLLSEIIIALHEMLPGIDVGIVKNSISGILLRYKVEQETVYQLESDILDKTKTFIAAKRVEGLSEKTLAGYKIELNLFAKAVDKRVEHIGPGDIRNYLGGLEGRKMSTIGKKLNVLRAFFAFLLEEELTKRNPALKIKSPKEEQRMGKALTIEELELLRESCDTIRKRAFLEIFYATGCRLDEMQRLNISDVDRYNKSCKVIGKGNKEREVYFSPKAMYHLEKYLASRNDDCPALLASIRKPYRRLSHRAIQDEIKRIAKRAGLAHKVTTHVLRHTFATLTLNQGADITAVQELLGHSSPETTLRYARITEERKREQHKRFLVQ